MNATLLLSQWIDIVAERAKVGSNEVSQEEEELAIQLLSRCDVDIDFLLGALHYLGVNIVTDANPMSRVRADEIVDAVRNMKEVEPMAGYERQFINGAEYAYNYEG